MLKLISLYKYAVNDKRQNGNTVRNNYHFY